VGRGTQEAVKRSTDFREAALEVKTSTRLVHATVINNFKKKIRKIDIPGTGRTCCCESSGLGRCRLGGCYLVWHDVDVVETDGLPRAGAIQGVDLKFCAAYMNPENKIRKLTSSEFA
jgi:hypothetical protein